MYSPIAKFASLPRCSCGRYGILLTDSCCGVGPRLLANNNMFIDEEHVNKNGSDPDLTPFLAVVDGPFRYYQIRKDLANSVLCPSLHLLTPQFPQSFLSF